MAVPPSFFASDKNPSFKMVMDALCSERDICRKNANSPEIPFENFDEDRYSNPTGKDYAYRAVVADFLARCGENAGAEGLLSALKNIQSRLGRAGQTSTSDPGFLSRQQRIWLDAALTDARNELIGKDGMGIGPEDIYVQKAATLAKKRRFLKHLPTAFTAGAAVNALISGATWLTLPEPSSVLPDEDTPSALVDPYSVPSDPDVVLKENIVMGTGLFAGALAALAGFIAVIKTRDATHDKAHIRYIAHQVTCALADIMKGNDKFISQKQGDSSIGL